MQRLTNLSFEAWVAHVFDHPVSDPAWYWNINRDQWDATGQPVTTVAYLTRLFSDPITALGSYSDAQLNQGLWFLVDNACSNHMLTLQDTTIPVADRIACIQAMVTLFEKLFAVRCDDTLGHLSHESNPLNLICYMWWDVMPIFPHVSHDTSHIDRMNASQATKAMIKAELLKIDLRDYARIQQACLSVMTQILEMDSDACRESALHGLGHWSLHHSEQIQPLIDAWLKRHPSLSPELKQYAESAKKGCIL